MDKKNIFLDCIYEPFKTLFSSSVGAITQKLPCWFLFVLLLIWAYWFIRKGQGSSCKNHTNLPQKKTRRSQMHYPVQVSGKIHLVECFFSLSLDMIWWIDINCVIFLLRNTNLIWSSEVNSWSMALNNEGQFFFLLFFYLEGEDKPLIIRVGP